MPKGSAIRHLIHQDLGHVFLLAQANSVDSMPCAGLADEDIEIGNYGRIAISGAVRLFNCAHLRVCEPAYVSAETPGALTSTPTGGPNLVQQVGVVLSNDPVTGSVELSIHEPTKK